MTDVNYVTKPLNFCSFVVSYISLSVIAGLFSFRLINSLLDNIILPLLDLTILPDKKFHKMSRMYNNNKQREKLEFKDSDNKYLIRPGIFLKDVIIWLAVMLILYFIYLTTK